MVKRKRSCSELSATTSCFSSPSRPEAMEIDMSPVSPLIAKSSRYITPSHLPSRTMKRIRDNRPSEEEIHGEFSQSPKLPATDAIAHLCMG